MKPFSSLLAPALLGLAACHASEPATAPGASSDLVVLRGATLIDGSGGPPIADATLVVRGETIEAVGPSASLATPEGARVVSLAGKTIMPGLISDHAHVGLTDGVTVGGGTYNRENILRQLRQYEVYGVTTIVSLGLNGAIFGGLRDEMHAAKNPGADMFGVVRGIGAPGGAPPDALVHPAPDQLFRPSTPDEARAAVREMVAQKTDLVKLWLDDYNGTLPALKPEVYRAAIEEAHAHGVRVAAHIHDLEAAKGVVRAGVDILAHGVRDKPVDSELVQLLKEHKVWYVPTLAVDDSSFVYASRPDLAKEPFVQHAMRPALLARLEDPGWRKQINDDPKTAGFRSGLENNLHNLKTLHDAGIAIGFGSDSGGSPYRVAGAAEHRELDLMVKAGLTPMEALTIATKNGADLLGLTDRGVLAKGKRADFLVLDADPSRDIANTRTISAVWHHGHAVSGKVDDFTP